jgi:sucrose-6-phosphate hydrolase SacC (GH32 family)
MLVLYLERDVYAIFRSDDLLNWREVQRISLSEDNECPDIFCLIDCDGIKRWVLMGAHGRYAIGDMTENGFVQIGEARSLHYGKAAYAGQSFSGIEGGRVIRVDWDRSNIRKDSFACQMGIPCEMALLKSDGEYFITANPINEIKALIKKSDVYKGVKLDQGTPVRYKTESCPYLIRIRAEEVAENASIILMLFGRRIQMNFSENKLVIGRHVCPLSISHNGLDLTVIADRLSIEIYLDGGRICTTFMEDSTVPDYMNIPYVELLADACATVDSIELNALTSIWESEK